MSPKYILVLLLVLVLAETPLANYPKRPPHKHPPKEDLSLEEQEKSHVNAYKPPIRRPPPTDLQNELSVTEKPNTEQNNKPQTTYHKGKPPHGPGHPPVEENAEEDKYYYKPPKKYPPHKPPHGPPTTN